MTNQKTAVDLDNLKLINEHEVPAKPKRYTPYREMLERIQKGKALVVSDDEVNVDTVRAAVRRLQAKGEYKRYELRQLKSVDGVTRLYIINPAEEQRGKSYRILQKPSEDRTAEK